MKSLLGCGHLSWDVDRKQGAFDGQPVSDDVCVPAPGAARPTSTRSVHVEAAPAAAPAAVLLPPLLMLRAELVVARALHGRRRRRARMDPCKDAHKRTPVRVQPSWWGNCEALLLLCAAVTCCKVLK